MLSGSKWRGVRNIAWIFGKRQCSLLAHWLPRLGHTHPPWLRGPCPSAETRRPGMSRTSSRGGRLVIARVSSSSRAQTLLLLERSDLPASAPASQHMSPRPTEGSNRSICTRCPSSSRAACRGDPLIALGLAWGALRPPLPDTRAVTSLPSPKPMRFVA